MTISILTQQAAGNLIWKISQCISNFNWNLCNLRNLWIKKLPYKKPDYKKISIFSPLGMLRAHSKITLHFIRRCLPPGCVAKTRNMPDIPALSRLAGRVPQRLKLRTYFRVNPEALNRGHPRHSRGDLCKTPLFAQFLCQTQILILKILNVFLLALWNAEPIPPGWLKFSPVLNSNKNEHFSKVSLD